MRNGAIQDLKDNGLVPQEGNTVVTVKIQLPKNSTISVDELVLSSLFTFGAKVKMGVGFAETFDGNEMELVYAKNAHGEIILLSFLNPSKSKRIVLDAKSTAVSLVMLHPWTMHLSVDAKEEAMLTISEMLGFSSYLKKVESAIASGKLDINVVSPLVTELRSLQGKMSLSIVPEQLKLTLPKENSKKNRIIGNNEISMGYDKRLYDAGDATILSLRYKNVISRTILSFSSIKNKLSAAISTIKNKSKHGICQREHS